MIAAHVPPYKAGSGYLRTLKFCQYLPRLGWAPRVLAPANRAFAAEDLDPATAGLLDCPVTRTFALDSARQLSIRGHYAGILAVPDRWCSWLLSAVFAGVRLIRKHRPALIFSTYPLATTHLVGLALARLTGVPWVADFRDPMIEEDYPPPGMARRARAAIERQTVQHCAAALFTTAGTLADYQRRFPASASKFHLLMNGYDEADFESSGSEDASARISSESSRPEPLTLLHSGSLDPDFRNPGPLFRALSELKEEGVVSAAALQLRLRACGRDALYRQQVADLHIQDLVQIAPAVPYPEALAEMQAADGVMLFQGAGANNQVPAKLFEYFRAGTAILALVRPEGDTAQLLHAAGVGRIARIDDRADIKAALLEFVADAAARRRWATPLHVAEAYSREASARQLAKILDALVEQPAVHQ